MTPLEQYDTIIDHLVKAKRLLYDSTVVNTVPMNKVILRDRMRELIGAQMQVTELLVHDYAELSGVFDDPEVFLKPLEQRIEDSKA
jgi:hypothetical protein